MMTEENKSEMSPQKKEQEQLEKDYLEGINYFELGMLKEAKTCFEKCYRTYQNYKLTRLHLALCYELEKDGVSNEEISPYSRELEAFECRVKNDPGSLIGDEWYLQCFVVDSNYIESGLIKGVIKNNSRAKYKLAQCYKKIETPSHQEKAKKLIMEAAEEGHVLAEFEYGQQLFEESKHALAFVFLTRATNKNHGKALPLLSKCCLIEGESFYDPELSLTLAIRARRAGLKISNNEMMSIFRKFPLDLLKKYAEKQNAIAMYVYALYRYDTLIKTKPTEALEELMTAAKLYPVEATLFERAYSSFTAMELINAANNEKPRALFSLLRRSLTITEGLLPYAYDCCTSYFFSQLKNLKYFKKINTETIYEQYREKKRGGENLSGAQEEECLALGVNLMLHHGGKHNINGAIEMFQLCSREYEEIAEECIDAIVWTHDNMSNKEEEEVSRIMRPA